MNVTIDRFEGKFAIVELEDKTFANMPKALLPKETKEGDVISINIDNEETDRRKHEILEQYNALLNK